MRDSTDDTPSVANVRLAVEREMGRVVKVLDREAWADLRAVLLYHFGTTDPATLHKALAARRQEEG